MKSMQILTHSIRQVFGNLGAALRISAVLYLVQMGVFVAVDVSLLGTQGEVQAMMMAGPFPWGRFALAMIVATITCLWIAVAWHRYVLLEEHPSAALPLLHADRMLAYLWRSILIAIAIWLLAMVVGFVLGLVVMPFAGNVSNPNFVIAALVPIIMYAVALLIFYRLSPMLPSVALGNDLLINDAWASTKGASGTFILLGIITATIIVATGAIGEALFGGLPVLPMAWQFVISWVYLMVGVSVLTTIYGHYVEKRALV